MIKQYILRIENKMKIFWLRLKATVKHVFCRKKNASYDYTVAVVCIIKNEGDYIEEWVKYHRLIGIDHIYLYDNGSTDNTAEILMPFIQDGYVDIIDFPGIARQLPAYNDALKRYGDRCNYMAFIDADEFIFMHDYSENIGGLIKKLLAKDPKSGGLAVNWRIFGSSGHLKKPVRGGCWTTFCIEQQKMDAAMAL